MVDSNGFCELSSAKETEVWIKQSCSTVVQINVNVSKCDP